MTFIRLHFTSGEAMWINAHLIESVIPRVDESGEPVGSRIRTVWGTKYDNIAQTPDEVLELLNRALNWGEVRDD